MAVNLDGKLALLRDLVARSTISDAWVEHDFLNRRFVVIRYGREVCLFAEQEVAQRFEAEITGRLNAAR